MIPTELVWWSHRMKPSSLTLSYSEPAQGQGTPKATHCQTPLLPTATASQHSPWKILPRTTLWLLQCSALLENWRGGTSTAKPHLSLSFLLEGEENQGLCGQGGCWYMLEALVEIEGGVSPSCCPCTPHQAELAGNVGLFLPPRGKGSALGTVLCFRSMIAPNSAHPAPSALPALASTSSACLYHGESLGCSRGHMR